VLSVAINFLQIIYFIFFEQSLSRFTF